MDRQTPGELLRLVGWLLLPIAVGGLSGAVTAGAIEGWYRSIVKPSFTPPDSLFGPVWSVLYLMMGVSVYLVLRTARRSSAPAQELFRLRLLFLVQLGLNGLWSLLFFGLRSPGLALVEIGLLWIAIGLTVRRFARHSTISAVLLCPYWAWVSFAAVLNGAIWWLNR